MIAAFARRAGRLAGLIVLSLAALAGVGTLALTALAQTGKVATFYVTSGSMEPEYSVGDLLIAAPVAAADVAVGDILTISAASGHKVTHRVTAIAPGTDPTTRLLTLKGDANRVADSTPYLVSDAWETKIAVPHLGRAQEALSDTQTRIWVAVSFAALIALTLLMPSAPGRATTPAQAASTAGVPGTDEPLTDGNEDAAEAPPTRASRRAPNR